MADVTVDCPGCQKSVPVGMFCASCGARLDGQETAPPCDEARVLNAVVPADEEVPEDSDDDGATSEVLANVQAVIPLQYADPVLQETAKRIRTMNGNGSKVNGNGSHEEPEKPIDDTPFRPIIADLLQQREELALKENDLVDFEKELAGKSEELKLRADLFSQREVQLAERECVVAECERKVENREAGHKKWIDETENDLRLRSADQDEREGRLIRREEDLNKSEQANRNRVDVIARREALAQESESKQLSRAESISEMEKMISDRTNALNQREADLDARESALGKREIATKKVAKSENIQAFLTVALGLAAIAAISYFFNWMF